VKWLTPPSYSEDTGFSSVPQKSTILNRGFSRFSQALNENDGIVAKK
jgi:hypothetical protein